jgi:hypothetical protein
VEYRQQAAFAEVIEKEYPPKTEIKETVNGLFNVRVLGLCLSRLSDLSPITLRWSVLGSRTKKHACATFLSKP